MSYGRRRSVALKCVSHEEVYYLTVQLVPAYYATVLISPKCIMPTFTKTSPYFSYRSYNVDYADVFLEDCFGAPCRL